MIFLPGPSPMPLESGASAFAAYGQEFCLPSGARINYSMISPNRLPAVGNRSMSTLENNGRDLENGPLPGGELVQEGAVLRKVSLRLLPFLFLLYVLNILDRANIGFAKLQMLHDLEMSETAYGLGAGLFYIGYLLFEVPANLILHRIGARAWIARILLTWGLISSGMMFVTGPWSFYLLRILLGVAEAGFFPGIIFYLSHWFPARERARAVATFMTAAVVASLVGNPLSGAILQFLDQSGGLAGWQWLFLLEGIPTILLGFVTLFYLTDRPVQARWLTESERNLLARRMEWEEQTRQQRHGVSLLGALRNPTVWLLIAVYFTVAFGDNSYGFFLPSLLQDKFPSATKWEIGLLAAAPSVMAIVGMVLIGVHSDRTGERRWHVAGPAFLAVVGWMMVALAPTKWLFVVGLGIASTGMKSMLPTFWSLPTAFLSGAAAAGGIALINSVANLGGFLGPFVIGHVKDRTGSFTDGLLLVAALLGIGGILVLWVRHDSTLERPSVRRKAGTPPQIEE
jgi:D-galactonate transporter